MGSELAVRSPQGLERQIQPDLGIRLIDRIGRFIVSTKDIRYNDGQLEYCETMIFYDDGPGVPDEFYEVFDTSNIALTRSPLRTTDINEAMSNHKRMKEFLETILPYLAPPYQAPPTQGSIERVNQDSHPTRI